MAHNLSNQFDLQFRIILKFAVLTVHELIYNNFMETICLLAYLAVWTKYTELKMLMIYCNLRFIATLIIFNTNVIGYFDRRARVNASHM